MQGEEVKDLLLQRFETEMAAVEIYKAALPCTSDPHQRRSWQRELDQTETHLEVVRRLCGELNFDLNEATPDRLLIRGVAQSIARALETSLAGGKSSAQAFATECVTLVGAANGFNWELIGRRAQVANEVGSTRTMPLPRRDDIRPLHDSRQWARGA